MTANRFYTSTNTPTQLTLGMNVSNSDLVVNDISGFPLPQFPFTLLVDNGSSTQELIQVNGSYTGSGPYTFDKTLVVRGVDGTTAQLHGAGATAVHAISARDISEPQTHLPLTTGVHGVTSTIVDTTSTQTLSNKTLSAPTIASLTNAQHNHSSDATGGLVSSTPSNIGTGVGRFLVGVKSADQSINNNASSNINDADIRATLEASATYTFQLWIYYLSPQAANFRVNLFNPTGCTLSWMVAGWGVDTTNRTSGGDKGRYTAFQGSPGTIVGSPAGGDQALSIRGLVRTTSAGDLGLAWRQGTANVNGTIVRKNSWLRLFRVA